MPARLRVILSRPTSTSLIRHEKAFVTSLVTPVTNSLSRFFPLRIGLGIVRESAILPNHERLTKRRK